jgi:signal transduction histidine kinase
VGRGLQLASGRVIALGRLLFAILFLTAMSVDVSQAAPFPAQTYALLVAYVLFAAGLVIITWNNWWLDAHLAGPAHAADIALFTLVVYQTQGSNPFFTFFVFVLLSAAIRWGWRATALTAILLTLLYVVASLIAVASQSEFQLDRFITRTGNLVIFSLILIWFGVNQWRARLAGPAERLLAEPSLDDSPLEITLRAAMAGAGSLAGAFVWSERPDGRAGVLIIRDDHAADSVDLTDSPIVRPAPTPFLYDLPKARALMRDRESNIRPFDPSDNIDAETASALQLSQGLAIPVTGPTVEGQLYLERLRGLSTDHLEVGEQIAAAIAAHLQRQTLMKAAEESAESRSRLTVARDLHDSVVQFLAGAAFRLEAMKRSESSGRDLTPELDELKQLMLQEQGELRSFITALRSGSLIQLADLARDLQTLADRLSRQWDVQCTFSLEPCEMMVPARLHLDAHQLVREAVANAVRHAGAKNVSIRLAGESDDVRLDFINDGAPYPKTADGRRMPASLRERVEAAGGAIDLSRGMGVTRVSISLPARNAA